MDGIKKRRCSVRRERRAGTEKAAVSGAERRLQGARVETPNEWRQPTVCVDVQRGPEPAPKWNGKGSGRGQSLAERGARDGRISDWRRGDG